jgi:osmotically-inducible protein OsmY
MVTHDHSVARRDDCDLQRRVVNYLFDRRVSSLRAIEVTASAGTVTLRGRVASYYEKQLCLHCCRRVAGVMRLIDEVVVTQSEKLLAMPI